MSSSQGQADVYVKLARKLAHVEREVRDAGLDNVRSFLRSRKSLPRPEMMKLWKGLFYSMWHSDKPLVQQELARSLSGLMHDVGWRDGFSFWSCFCETIAREWQGIDKLRLDKFYDLCRCMTQDVLLLLKNHRWESAMVGEFIQLFVEHVLNGASLAVKLQLLDYWVADLTAATCPIPAVMLQPVVDLLATTPNDVLIKRILEGVIENAPQLPGLDVAALGQKCFAMGADPAVAQRNRKALYAAHKMLCGEIQTQLEVETIAKMHEEMQKRKEEEAAAAKANKRKVRRQKVAKGVEIDTVVPHVPKFKPQKPEVEENGGHEEEEDGDDGNDNDNNEHEQERVEEKSQKLQQQQLKKMKTKKKNSIKERLQLKKRAHSDEFINEDGEEAPTLVSADLPKPQQQQTIVQQQPIKHSSPKKASKPIVKKSKTASANDSFEVVAEDAGKPSPSKVLDTPEPPKMVKLKKTPSSTGKNVTFDLSKNETHTFKKVNQVRRHSFGF